MPTPDKDALRRLFQFRCGYCGIRESNAGSELTVDHFQPRTRGGTDDATNLVYCCHACNEFKGDFWQPDSPRRLLHPLRDDPSAHMVEDPDGRLRALTDTGDFHIDRLRLNRPQLVEYRRERRLLDAARRAERQLLDHLRALDERLGNLIADLDRLRSDGA
jgi:hypothetical protein